MATTTAAQNAADRPPPADPGTAPSSEHQNAPPPAVEAAPSGAGPTASTEQQMPIVKRDPVPFVPTNADEMYRYARMLAGASLLPRAFYDRDDKERRSPKIADVHFVLLKGHALGLHPMTAIGNINVIDGKAEVGALLMVSMIRKSGLCEFWRLKHSDDRAAVYVTKRVGDDAPVEFTYTIEEADQMGLLDKGRTDWARENNQWKKQPRTMLRRRCQSMLAREVYPDVVVGMYDHDELGEQKEIELRLREIALGINPDRVVPVTVSEAISEVGRRMEAAPPELPAPKSDPLMERLRARQAQDAAREPALVLAPGEIACTGCGVPILAKSGKLCGACLNS